MDYTKSVIYKIACLNTSVKEIYVGSTLNFKQRKREHKCNCNNPNDKSYNYYVYKFIREHGGWENWDMFIIKNLACNSRRELLIEEDRVMRDLNASLNTYYPVLDIEKNKERLQLYDKEYREKNKEHLQLYKKEYHEKNKEKINAYRAEKIVCECGCVIRRSDISRHRKTKKHNDLMNKPI